MGQWYRHFDTHSRTPLKNEIFMNVKIQENVGINKECVDAFVSGSPDSTRSINEKTILLVGATGTGKSTLVDGFVNYILGVNWNDPFRYTVINLEKEEKDKIKDQVSEL